MAPSWAAVPGQCGCLGPGAQGQLCPGAEGTACGSPPETAPRALRVCPGRRWKEPQLPVSSVPGIRGPGEAAKMSNDPPPPYPGGPTAPLLEEKSGAPPTPGRTSPAVMQPPPGMSLPPADIGPPPYEPPSHPTPQPGFIPPHVNADGTYMPPGFYPPPGPHPPMGYYPPGPYPPGPYAGPGGHTATVLVPSGAATTVTVLQGEIFEGAPVQTVCPHCQQAITTKISYEIGLMNFVLGFFCCFMGCDLGCCLIPCLINDFKDVTHTCPSCKAYIYTYKRLC